MENDQLEEYIKEAKRIEEDSLYSSKSHYNASAFWHKVYFWIGIPNSILAAIASASAFEGSTTLAGSLAVIVASIAAASTFLNPESRSSTHKNSAGEYHALRNRARIFVNITSKRNLDVDVLNGHFDELVSQRENLNSISSQIPESAFHKARKGIESGEASHKD
ncbi:SLATT domain-containing protein [Porticoccaceae bacterium]|jgi:hypothetical protein|nr:SLATT domain-containing protein [Porticoccaceae bacterium]